MECRKKVIAAVRDIGEFEQALLSDTETIFFLYSDITELDNIAKRAHEKGKRVFIHIDLTTGLGKDKSGLEFAKRACIDGIISTKNNLIKIAHESSLMTVQRFFVVDSRSIDTTLESLKNSKTDMIEIMPGIAPKIIQRLKMQTSVPIIAGGLIDTKEEVNTAIDNGAYAISTGCTDLWGI